MPAGTPVDDMLYGKQVGMCALSLALHYCSHSTVLYMLDYFSVNKIPAASGEESTILDSVAKRNLARAFRSLSEGSISEKILVLFSK